MLLAVSGLGPRSAISVQLVYPRACWAFKVVCKKIAKSVLEFRRSVLLGHLFKLAVPQRRLCSSVSPMHHSGRMRKPRAAS